MYNNNYVSSGIITGTQWDVILNKMKDKAGLSESDITNSSSWGNYKNTSISYNGRKTTAYKNSSNWILPPFGSVDSGKTSTYTDDNHGDLLTTGASATTQQYHIFDIAGNLWEWTEEDSHSAISGQRRVSRGGSSVRASSDFPACYRDYFDVSYTATQVGFRVVLYIK